MLRAPAPVPDPKVSGERNYHIFYQILEGMDEDSKIALGLTRAPNYSYLSKSGTFLGRSRDDAKDFLATVDAMKALGFTKKERNTVLGVVAAILHLGNIKFSGEEIANIENPEIIRDHVSHLLGVECAILSDALILPHRKYLDAPHAAASRDSFVKALYGRLFLWIVSKINLKLRDRVPHKSIGVLDISGFASFKHNSFEQLCINFTNEWLQHFFNQNMFEYEQLEYQREGIAWKVENFGLDCRATLDLIGTRPKGILVLLDEDRVSGSQDDVAFTRRIYEMHKNHPNFCYKQFATNVEFTLRHFTGEVTYNSSDWLHKNEDNLGEAIERLIRKSTNSVLAEFFSEFGPSEEEEKIVTTAARYRIQMNDLFKDLQKTRPHFIRCLVPNLEEKSELFEGAAVVDQLRPTGIVEGTKISRTGYPHRQKFEDFLKNYYFLGHGIPKTSKDPKQGCQQLVAQFYKSGIIQEKDPKGQKNVQLGASKIFFRASVSNALKEAREEWLDSLVAVTQAAVRGLLVRRRYLDPASRVCYCSPLLPSSSLL
jgi:myosin heavy subunit